MTDPPVHVRELLAVILCLIAAEVLCALLILRQLGWVGA